MPAGEIEATEPAKRVTAASLDRSEVVTSSRSTQRTPIQSSGREATWTGRQAMDHANDRGSFWTTTTAVLAVACTIGALYLPLVL